MSLMGLRSRLQILFNGWYMIRNSKFSFAGTISTLVERKVWGREKRMRLLKVRRMCSMEEKKRLAAAECEACHRFDTAKGGRG